MRKTEYWNNYTYTCLCPSWFPSKKTHLLLEQIPSLGFCHAGEPGCRTADLCDYKGLCEFTKLRKLKKSPCDIPDWEVSLHNLSRILSEGRRETMTEETGAVQRACSIPLVKEWAPWRPGWNLGGGRYLITSFTDK